LQGSGVTDPLSSGYDWAPPWGSFRPNPPNLEEVIRGKNYGCELTAVNYIDLRTRLMVTIYYSKVLALLGAGEKGSG
jgi:hypothetical protein